MDSQHEINLLEYAFAQVCEQLPPVRRAYENDGHLTLPAFLQQTLRVSTDPLQPRADLLDVVYRYAAPLLGETIAATAAQELQNSPAVLTSNHHGADFLAQSLQGGLIFSLREINGKPATTVPVFACGNISLNNPTYPQGLLLYHCPPRAERFTLPAKLPIFPNRLKRRSVSGAEAYNTDMLARAKWRTSTLLQDGQLPPLLATTVETILDKIYSNSKVMTLPSYSQQAVVLNNQLWKHCFHEPEQAPEMVYLELEHITSGLLQTDLSNEDSLLWQLMFNPDLRTSLLQQLDGTKICWDQSKLADRLRPDPDSLPTKLGGSGTIFFWPVNELGWRVPLHLTHSDRQAATLQGRDERGKLWQLPFQPAAILQALQTGRLLPSLFTCYLTVGLTRGVSCCGGYFQAQYLPAIQRGLIQVLEDNNFGLDKLAKQLAQVPTDISLLGMQGVMRQLDETLLLPAGLVEIMASGGLKQHQLQQLRTLTVQNALLAGLAEILPDIRYHDTMPANWPLYLAAKSHEKLTDKVVII